MCVDYIVTFICCYIICYNFFGNSVLDFYSFSLVLRQASELPCPVIIFCYSLAVDLFAVCKQIDRDGFRSYAVLVFVVFEDLLLFNAVSVRSVLGG